MGASGFGTLAGHFPDRTVVTYDPRGVERSTKADPASPSTPEQHADDLHRIIAELDAGPVDLFASSGGAVNALALVARHPEQVRTLVAHEPPLASILPDREGAMAAYPGDPRHVRAQRVRGRHGPVHRRREPPGADQPGRSPASPRPIRRCSGCRPRTTATAPTRCWARTSSPAPTTSPTSRRCGRPRRGSSWPPASSRRARWRIAARSPSPSGSARAPVSFPSDHGGFLGGEYGQAGDPDAFAAKLREVLAEA